MQPRKSQVHILSAQVTLCRQKAKKYAAFIQPAKLSSPKLCFGANFYFIWFDYDNVGCMVYAAEHVQTDHPVSIMDIAETDGCHAVPRVYKMQPWTPPLQPRI